MKASALLRDVAAHARTLDRQRYRPHSSYWHIPAPEVTEFEGHCLICFAGAWLTLHFDPDYEVSLDSLMPKEQAIAQFLEYIRTCDYEGISHDAGIAGIDNPITLEETLHELAEKREQIPHALMDYNIFNDWEGFERFLGGVEQLADILEKARL